MNVLQLVTDHTLNFSLSAFFVPSLSFLSFSFFSNLCLYFGLNGLAVAEQVPKTQTRSQSLKATPTGRCTKVCERGHRSNSRLLSWYQINPITVCASVAGSRLSVIKGQCRLTLIQSAQRLRGCGIIPDAVVQLDWRRKCFATACI